jgi:hypothetical protein
MMKRRTFPLAAAACAATLALTLAAPGLPQKRKKRPDAPFVPSTEELTQAMLELANGHG